MKTSASANSVNADLSLGLASVKPRSFAADAQHALAVFENALLARGSPETTRRYLGACKVLASRLGGAALADTDWRDAQRCLAALHASGMAARTLATMLSAWKTWFRVLAKHDHRYRADAFDAVRVPKPAKRLPNALTESEMAQLLAPTAQDVSPDDGATETWIARDRAMFELLYGCGMRVGELSGLDVSDLDLVAGEVRVYGKGRKERVLPLGQKAVVALRSWLPLRLQRVVSADERALFIGSRGGRVAATVVRRALESTARSAGIASHVHPHRLRHSFASHVLQSSRDLRAVQELMGHASIASTQVYTHLDFQHLAVVYDESHPRARKKK